MSEHYPMELRIGGKLPHSKVDRFMKLFLEAAWLPTEDRAQQLDHFLAEDGTFAHADDDCNPSCFDELLKFCRELGMAYVCRVGSNGVDAPVIEYHQSGVGGQRYIWLTMEHESYVRAVDLDAALNRYCVSSQERLRNIRKLVPLVKPPDPEKLEVVDG